MKQALLMDLPLMMKMGILLTVKATVMVSLRVVRMVETKMRGVGVNYYRTKMKARQHRSGTIDMIFKVLLPQKTVGDRLHSLINV